MFWNKVPFLGHRKFNFLCIILHGWFVCSKDKLFMAKKSMQFCGQSKLRAKYKFSITSFLLL